MNLAEPPERPDPSIDPCWRVFLIDTLGRQVAASGDVVLPAGQTKTFTLERGRLERSEDERTGRIQLRVVIVVEHEATHETPDPSQFRPALEIVTSASGRTRLAIQGVPEPDRF